MVNIISHLLRVFCILDCLESFVESSEEEALHVWIQDICKPTKLIETKFECDYHGQELSLVTDQDAVAHDWADCFEKVFDWVRRNILTSSCDYQILDPAGDLKATIFVNVAYVSSVEESLFVERLEIFGFSLEVAHEDVSSFNTNFSSTINLRVENLDLCAW